MSEPNPTPPKKGEPRFVSVAELRPDGYESTCLRPLGLCDLGGCCDVCWYNPDNQAARNAARRDQES